MIIFYYLNDKTNVFIYEIVYTTEYLN